MIGKQNEFGSWRRGRLKAKGRCPFVEPVHKGTKDIVSANILFNGLHLWRRVDTSRLTAIASKGKSNTSAAPLAVAALCCHLGAGCVQKEAVYRRFCPEAAGLRSWLSLNPLSLQECPQELVIFFYSPLASSLGFGHRHLLVSFFVCLFYLRLCLAVHLFLDFFLP